MNLRKRILAADDDATALNALRQTLVQRGYDVVAVPSGDEAIMQAAEQDFDLFILDINMPGLSGLEVCQKLRESEKTRDKPVIFLTARGTVSDMVKGKQAGSDLYLVKPVLANKLLSMVGMFLSTEVPLAKKRKE
jgi:DNA-binding response OmpR family regulator